MVMLADAGDAIMMEYWDEVDPRLALVVLVSVVSAVTVRAPAIAESR
jgi:hypothetical protein